MADQRELSIAADDQRCFLMLMQQFRDATKPDGVAAMRRYEVLLSIVDALIRKEREACAAMCDAHGRLSGWRSVRRNQGAEVSMPDHLRGTDGAR